MSWVMKLPQPARRLTPRRGATLRDRVLQAKFRRVILARDGYRCSNCQRSEAEIKEDQPGWNVLEASHIHSKQAYTTDDPAFYAPENGRALCRRCHRLLPKEEM